MTEMEVISTLIMLGFKKVTNESSIVNVTLMRKNLVIYVSKKGMIISKLKSFPIKYMEYDSGLKLVIEELENG